jgi:hypothetical protein
VWAQPPAERHPLSISQQSWPPPSLLQQAQQQHAPCAAEEGAGSIASSPSLRLPASESSGGGGRPQRAAAECAAPAEGQLQFHLQPLHPQPHPPAASRSFSQAGSDSGVQSLSRHWDLPSPKGELT